MIHINNLSFHYKKDKPILQNISTTLAPGHIYGLLGTNGEGKTTLIKLLAGLIFPKNGALQVNNLDVKSRSLAFFEQIYLLPDQPKSKNLKIKDYQKIYSVFYKNFSAEFFENALKDFSIDPNEKTGNLSLGQQKKFQLAFALSCNTQILLLDEPTNGLDIPGKSIVRQLLAKSITENKTFIISTHLIKDIENLIDHLLILCDGQLVFDHSTGEILNKYVFTQTNTTEIDAIYSEKSITTHRNILLNTENRESNIDIELLFNGVINHKI